MSDHEEINRLRLRIDGLEDDIKTMREESYQRELQRWRWGVTALGAVVVALGTWAWSQIGDLVTLTVGKK